MICICGNEITRDNLECHGQCIINAKVRLDELENKPKLNPMETIIEKLEEHKKAIALHRDALRVLREEIADIEGSTEEGVECLEEAINYLSEYL